MASTKRQRGVLHTRQINNASALTVYNFLLEHQKIVRENEYTDIKLVMTDVVGTVHTEEAYCLGSVRLFEYLHRYVYTKLYINTTQNTQLYYVLDRRRYDVKIIVRDKSTVLNDQNSKKIKKTPFYRTESVNLQKVVEITRSELTESNTCFCFKKELNYTLNFDKLKTIICTKCGKQYNDLHKGNLPKFTQNESYNTIFNSFASNNNEKE